ncbi:GNAT family N-acetyltransferase [Sporomusa aerivorans]|uniref:GNAT family N-acetyltransferase n=1 Tax=Sporomusa aerivorans TaxID=204936 RepID=UPI00352A68FB
MVREMDIYDVDHVVAIHLRSFSGFFLSFLGYQFLKAYYSAVCYAADGLRFVFLDESGKIAGFVVGASNPRGFYSRLLKRDWYKFAAASVEAIFRNPLIIPRLLRALLFPGSNPVGLHVAGLFSIAVSPSDQTKGGGTMLLSAFIAEAGRRGCKQIVLTTDKDNNDAVNKFYVKNGLEVSRQYSTPEGRQMNEYCLDIALHA